MPRFLGQRINPPPASPLFQRLSEQRKWLLRGLILGSSAKIETPGHVVDFGDRDVIRVYPDDEIEVSVWDDDVFNDDLYGRATVTLDRATLGHGSLDVSMPNVKFVRLKFRRDESATVPE